MSGFLIEYHRPTGDWSVQEFPGGSGRAEALEASFRMEKRRANSDYEIAVLTTDSIETLRSTHSRYFSGNEQQPGFSEAA